MTISILEMLLGLQIGLVCHNPGWETKEVSIPLAITGQRDLPEAVVYDAAGNCLSRQKVEPHGETATARATVPAGCWMVVEAERP